MPSKKEIEVAAKSMASQCFDLEQSSEFYKNRGIAWDVIAKAALEAAEKVRDNKAQRMQEALEKLLKCYLGLANSGDCGFWDPEEEEEVIQAKQALSKE